MSLDNVISFSAHRTPISDGIIYSQSIEYILTYSIGAWLKMRPRTKKHPLTSKRYNAQTT